VTAGFSTIRSGIAVIREGVKILYIAGPDALPGHHAADLV
jgi:hypothetical protein